MNSINNEERSQIKQVKEKYMQQMMMNAPVKARKGINLSNELRNAFVEAKTKGDMSIFHGARASILGSVGSIEYLMSSNNNRSLKEIKNSLSSLERRMTILETDMLLYKIDNQYQ